MKFRILNQLNDSLYAILRRAGYVPLHDRLTGKDSYARKILTGHYPRFHLYLSTEGENLVFDLHLDQNENSYQGASHAHNADYESSEVKQELIRIYQVLVPSIKK